MWTRERLKFLVPWLGYCRALSRSSAAVSQPHPLAAFNPERYTLNRSGRRGELRRALRNSAAVPQPDPSAAFNSERYTRAITRSGRRGEWQRALTLLDACERAMLPAPICTRAATAAMIAH